MKSGLRQRKSDPLKRKLDAAMKALGEKTMENVFLRKGLGRRQVSFKRWRSRK